VLSLGAALEIPLMIGLGSLAARLTTRTIVLWGVLTGAVYYAVLAVAPGLWLVLGGQIVAAVFVSVLMGVGIGYFQDLMPRSAGVATTLYANSGQVARVLGSLMGGVLAQTIGLRDVFWLCAVLVVLAFGILALSVRAAARREGGPRRRTTALRAAATPGG